MHTDPTGDDGLTDGERAELDAEKAGKAPGADDAAAAAAAAKTDDGAAAAAVVEEPAPVVKDDPAAASAKAMAEAAGAITKAAEAMAAANTRQPEKVEQAPARDFDAERVALKVQFDKGEIDEDEYENRRERLLEEKADFKAAERFNAMSAERDQAAAQAEWTRTVRAFQSDPANAKLFDDTTRNGSFNALVHAVAAENPNGSYLDWLNTARERTLSAFGIVTKAPSADEAAKQAEAIKKAEAERAAAAGKATPTLDTAPAAGAQIATGPEAQLDALPISDLEDALARMPADKAEQYLASAPGGLRDNPRAA